MKHKAFFIFMTALLIGSPLYAQKYKIALIQAHPINQGENSLIL